MYRSFGVLLAAIFAIFLPVASWAQPAVPKVPKEIAVPPGHKLLFKVEAKGVQIYKAVEGKGDALEWVLDAPLADLFEEKGGKAGWHYEGPSWEAVDGMRRTIISFSLHFCVCCGVHYQLVIPLRS